MKYNDFKSQTTEADRAFLMFLFVSAGLLIMLITGCSSLDTNGRLSTVAGKSYYAGCAGDKLGDPYTQIVCYNEARQFERMVKKAFQRN